MSDPTTELPSVTWRMRKIRRAAGTLGAAVVLATIGPAIANAAGGDVANPIAAALRASGRTLASAFDADEGTCVTPGTDESEAPGEETTALPSADPAEETTDSGDGTEGTEGEGTDGGEDAGDEGTDGGTEPSAEPTDLPSGEPVEDDCDAEESESPAPSESPSASPTEEVDEPEESEEGNHGQIVSTVAKCSPRGKDPLLDVEGAPSNHGGYVKVAAHGDTLTLPWGSYDLSTQAGADDLCASLEAARADLEDEATEKKAKKNKAKHGRPDKAGKGGKGHGKK